MTLLQLGGLLPVTLAFELPAATTIMPPPGDNFVDGRLHGRRAGSSAAQAEAEDMGFPLKTKMQVGLYRPAYQSES